MPRLVVSERQAQAASISFLDPLPLNFFTRLQRKKSQKASKLKQAMVNGEVNGERNNHDVPIG